MRRAGKEPAASPDADLAGPARRTRQRTQSRGPPQLDLFASPSVASGPGRALPPAGVGPPIPFPLDARARLLASLKSEKHKEMVQAGMNVSMNVQRVRVP